MILQMEQNMLTGQSKKAPRPALTSWGARRIKDALFTDDRWQIHAAGGDTWAERQGWQTIIAHMCVDAHGAPFWMLLEHHRDPEICMYCKEPMPEGIVALFKLQNMDMIHGG
jgi:hypothetical protein